jgi:hypothetical protein
MASLGVKGARRANANVKANDSGAVVFFHGYVFFA